MILCGSASSWMVKRIINNRGGLYGRLTRIMRLLPFKLCETEEFLRAHNIELDRKQILELYMAIGGIPPLFGHDQKGHVCNSRDQRPFFPTKCAPLPGI